MSGYGETRSFETHPGEGGVESDSGEEETT